MRLRWLIAGLAVWLGTAAPARAGLDQFIAECMDNFADLQAMSPALEAAGMRDAAPGVGPRTFAFPEAVTRRVWTDESELWPYAFTGLTVFAKDGAKVEICWHTSSPGDSAASGFASLHARYGELSGTEHSRDGLLGSGVQEWGVELAGGEAVIGLMWPRRDQPEQGPAMFYLIKFTSPHGPVKIGRGKQVLAPD